jgi:hypothetical protein
VAAAGAFDKALEANLFPHRVGAQDEPFKDARLGLIALLPGGPGGQLPGGASIRRMSVAVGDRGACHHRGRRRDATLRRRGGLWFNGLLFVIARPA